MFVYISILFVTTKIGTSMMNTACFSKVYGRMYKSKEVKSNTSIYVYSFMNTYSKVQRKNNENIKGAVCIQFIYKKFNTYLYLKNILRSEHYFQNTAFIWASTNKQ